MADECGANLIYPSQSTWKDEPAYTPAEEGFIQVDGAKLWYQDGGGTGVPIVLLHAATGSAASWRYQQHRLAAEGYRVIVYSRRGHYRSTVENPQLKISGADDLLALSQTLELPKFHLVGTAVGGFTAMDFALSHPERLRSLVIASSLGGIDEPEFVEVTKRLLTPDVMALPSYIKELGPSYRALNPIGTRRWIELETIASSGKPALQPKDNRVTWESLKRLPPTMFLTGDADLYMPPALFTLIKPHIPGAHFVVIAEAGHSTSWEQPDAFNTAVLSFVGQH
jgi:pimeloyl-ACP methyl ester carboxylesterase